ncbi:MAG: hypothetical protein ACTHVH_06325 [Microbacterium gubbeenense]|uniref:hypothetical protein n=1 Tax=Microbacterium gubbeenense TaxID=159896 RepID=UPI003F94BAA0
MTSFSRIPPSTYQVSYVGESFHVPAFPKNHPWSLVDFESAVRHPAVAYVEAHGALGACAYRQVIEHRLGHQTRVRRAPRFDVHARDAWRVLDHGISGSHGITVPVSSRR